MVLQPEGIELSQIHHKPVDKKASWPQDGAAKAPTPPDQDELELPPPSTATYVPERWNYPRSNIPKVIACNWSFVVMGANDAAYGVSNMAS